MGLDETTLFAYFLVTILATGFWVAINISPLRKGKVTIGSLFLLIAMLGTAWGIIRWGMR